MKNISDFISVIGSSQANITINISLYSIEAIHAAIYSFTGNYHVLITPNADNSVTVIFEAKEKKAVEVIDDLKKFADALIDHQVRLQLDKANGRIRDLIVAHAFSPLDLNKELESL